MSAATLRLDPEMLRRIFLYDSGVLYWRFRPDGTRKWNSRFANKPAGCATKERGGSYQRCVVRLDGRLYKVHRVIWAVVTGSDPGHMEIDHVDHDPSNNRIENLRLATRSQNQANTRPRRRDLPKGVVRHRSGYVAQAGRYLGFFRTISDAAAAYANDARARFGSFACLEADPVR